MKKILIKLDKQIKICKSMIDSTIIYLNMIQFNENKYKKSKSLFIYFKFEHFSEIR